MLKWYMSLIDKLISRLEFYFAQDTSSKIAICILMLCEDLILTEWVQNKVAIWYYKLLGGYKL